MLHGPVALVKSVMVLVQLSINELMKSENSKFTLLKKRLGSVLIADSERFQITRC